MGCNPRNAGELLSAVARVTGVRPRSGNHVQIFRFPVTSADGKACAINIRVSSKTFYRSNLTQVANELRVAIDDLPDALDWTPEELRRHLEQFPASVLDSPAALQMFRDVEG